MSDLENKNSRVADYDKRAENSDIVFYYAREERQGQRRLSASDMLRNVNTRPGLIRSIAGNRGNFFVMIFILLISIMFIMSSRHSADRQRAELRLGQNTITLSVLEEEAVSFLSINKAARRNAYTGAVDISASPALPMGQGELRFVTHRIFFSDETQEIFRLSLPFEGDEIIVIFRTENETVSHTVRKRY